MANRKTSGVKFKGVYIDTAPGAAGNYSEAVNAKSHRVGKMFLSIIGIFNANVLLQFRPAGDPTWTTYETYTDTTRQVIEDYSDCDYRVGVASGGFTSGAVRARIEYHIGESK